MNAVRADWLILDDVQTLSIVNHIPLATISALFPASADPNRPGAAIVFMFCPPEDNDIGMFSRQFFFHACPFLQMFP